MRYSLPKSVELGGKEYAIRSDYRDILDILEMLSDSELDSADKAEAVMEMFYPDYEDIPYTEYENAVRQCISFINCGEEECRDEKRPKLMDWQQDFPMIASPINRVLGTEIRSLEYLHWCTFIAAYQEIGDCTFAQVVSIRKKKSKNQKLDKSDQEFYKQNKHLVDFKRQYTDSDEKVINQWI